MSDTKCGHPKRFLFIPKDYGACAVCYRVPFVIREYAGDLCGIEVNESDPINMLQAIVDDHHLKDEQGNHIGDSTAARLAFADWLDEQGGPRGELIRVECQLEAMGDELPGESEWWLDWLERLSICGGSKSHIMFRKVWIPSIKLRKRRSELRQQLGYDTPVELSRNT